MRQVFLTITMIVVAFFGGTLLNSACNRWMQSWLLNYMGLRDGGEITSIDAPPRSPEAPGDSQSGTPVASRNAITEANSGTLGLIPQAEPHTTQSRVIAGNESTTATTSANKNQSTSPPKDTRSKSSRGVSQDSILPRQEPSSREPPGSQFPFRADEAQEHQGKDKTANLTETPPAPLDPSVGSALLASLTPGPPKSESTVGVDSIPLEVAPTSRQPGHSIDGSLFSKGAVSVAPLADSREVSREWMKLRQKLKLLGVTRYTIDGSPSGHVNFVCLIPIAGRQAVSQRFEGEGEDEVQAAQLAIRRILLWRASSPIMPPTRPR